MRSDRTTILAVAAAAIIGIAVGALWQHAATRGQARELVTARHELVFLRLEATLAAATVEAQRGNYEIARQLASGFYGDLQRETGAAQAGPQAAFGEILQQRDATITALSRADTQSGSMLAQQFTRYRLAVGKPVGGASAGGTAPPAAPPAVADTLPAP
jgi:hypothetical protein